MPFLLKDVSEVTPQKICEYIKMHRTGLSARYQRLEDYYKGKQDILYRTPKRKDDPCNNVVCNYAKYITDIGSGFLIGEPISYQSDENLTDLLEWFKLAEADVQDNDNAEDQSIYGVAYELVYMSSDEDPTPKTASIHPSQGFVIYNNTVELIPIAGVYYHETRDNVTQQVNGYDAEISTEQEYIRFHLTADFAIDGEVESGIQNPFQAVTLIEIYNNRFLQGDFEQLISLIDGYNKQQSNRIDDKENFVNSLMVLKGQTLGYNQEEKAETYQDIKDNGVIELTEGSDLSFLTRQSDQAGDQLLSDSIAKDIHKFSYIPDLTDEHFAANVSGVAMQFKLWGLNQLMKKKERYLKEGIRYRIKLFSNILAIKGKKPVDVEKVTITITRNLPKNLVEIAQVIGNLEGICSKETLVAQLPFVEDPEKEVEKATEEKQRAMDEQFVMATKSVNDNDEE